MRWPLFCILRENEQADTYDNEAIGDVKGRPGRPGEPAEAPDTVELRPSEPDAFDEVYHSAHMTGLRSAGRENADNRRDLERWDSGSFRGRCRPNACGWRK